VADADAQVRAGKLSQAEDLYNQALASIPEIARSYAYFTARSREADAARQVALRAGLTRAESAFDAGRYADMLSAYKEALAYLPETSARLDRTLSNIGAASAAQAGQKTQVEQSRAAAPILTRANALLKQGQYSDALAQFLTILATYPASTQAPPAAKGISDAAAGMNGTADARLASREKDLGDQVSSLQKSLAGRSD
jgi:tetratricopeptide (TPR) repeat protein